VGGIGICGRTYAAQWTQGLRTIPIQIGETAEPEPQPMKISGQCGRLTLLWLRGRSVQDQKIRTPGRLRIAEASA